MNSLDFRLPRIAVCDKKEAIIYEITKWLWKCNQDVREKTKSLGCKKNRRISRMPRHSCCEVRVMQLHDILLLRTSAILPEAISAGGLTPTTDTSLFLTTYRGGSHLPADILDPEKGTKKQNYIIIGYALKYVSATKIILHMSMLQNIRIVIQTNLTATNSAKKKLNVYGPCRRIPIIRLF